MVSLLSGHTRGFQRRIPFDGRSVSLRGLFGEKMRQEFALKPQVVNGPKVRNGVLE